MQVFERGTPQEFPPDAVVVRLRRSMGRTFAEVIGPEASDYPALNLVAEMPEPVLTALARAERMAQQHHRSRVVIVCEEDDLWAAEWGALR